jgi:hypothetical protein
MSEEHTTLCELCGEPMPPNEQMFKFHGYSGPCPKPPIARAERKTLTVNLDPPSPTVCPNCRSDKEAALVDSVIFIQKDNDTGTFSPQLCWCDHCKVFFC